MKKVFEPVTKLPENTSEDITKTITETSIKNNKTLEILNEQILELMNDKGMIAPNIASSLVNLFTPENKSQFRLVTDFISTRMNGFLINASVPVSLYSNMLNFRESNKSIKLDGDLLKTMTNNKVNADNSKLQDGKIICRRN